MQLGKIGAAAIASGFVLGGLLAVIAGGPIWLGSAYAALALVLWLLPTQRGRPAGVAPRHARARERVPAQPPRPAVTQEPAAESGGPAVSGPGPTAPSRSNTSAPPATEAPTATPVAESGKSTATPAAAGDQTAPTRSHQSTGDRVGASVASRAPVEPAWPAAPSGPAPSDRSQARARPSLTADTRQTASMVAPARDQHATRPAAPERTPTDATTHPHAATSASHPVQPASGAIGYMVSDTQATGNRLPDASEPIQARCRARGLTLITIARDTQATRTDGRERPALRWTLQQLADDHAQTLIVTHLNHLGDNPAQLAQLLRWLDEHERTLIALDCGLDTSTEAGRIAANALIRIGARRQPRTARPANEPGHSRHVGRRAAVSDVPELSDRIRRLRAQGMTLQAIADILNTEGIPTIRGGAKWRPSSVQAATGYRRPAPKRLDLPPGTHAK